MYVLGHEVYTKAGHAIGSIARIYRLAAELAKALTANSKLYIEAASIAYRQA